MAIFCLLIAAISGLLVWFYARAKFGRDHATATEKVAHLTTALEQVSAESENRLAENQHLKVAMGVAEEKAANLERLMASKGEELEKLNERFKKEFENLANRILDEKSEKFTALNRTQLDIILNPFKEKIKQFEEKVEKTHESELRDRISLKEEIKQLVDLNKQVSEDAANLTNALKGDSKLRGDWGELYLETILEKSGLEKDVHYTTQSGFRDDEGNMKKPDLIIRLPENKNLVIDSKVSLAAYDRYYAAESEEDRQAQLKNHLSSIRNHIRDLGGKNYQSLHDINSPDYVLMYIPIEPAYTLAVQNDPVLFTEALEKNIVMVTTSTLLATMRTVSFIWKQDNQKKHVLEIARQSGALYDKFVGFAEDLILVGKRMDEAKGAYSLAMGKLAEGKGNLVSRAEKIRALGAKTNKSLPDNLLQRAQQHGTNPELDGLDDSSEEEENLGVDEH